MTDNFKQLTRNVRDKKIAGVCGGLARYLDVDPNVVRIIFLIALLAVGGGLIAYLIIWLIAPEDPNY